MNIIQAMQRTIRDAMNITGKNLVLYDCEGKRVTGAVLEQEVDPVKIIEFYNSAADKLEISGEHLFKIYDDGEPYYVLMIQGYDANNIYMLGSLVSAQLQNIIKIYREKESKLSFIQNLLMDNLLQVDIFNRSRQLKIPMERKRAVFLVELKSSEDNNCAKVLSNLFVDKAYVTAVDEKNIVVVMEFADNDNEAKLDSVAKTMLDMINSETMTHVRIGYGGIMGSLKELSRSYKEAKLALDVGKIFYPAQTIIAYSSLGIGRLIYQLPLNLCEMFMKETFTEASMEELDDETIQTVIKFFENNLNVSETARQLYIHRNTLVYRLEKLEKTSGLDVRQFEDALTFRIAMMVSNYMNYLKKTNED